MVNGNQHRQHVGVEVRNMREEKIMYRRGKIGREFQCAGNKFEGRGKIGGPRGLDSTARKREQQERVGHGTRHGLDFAETRLENRDRGSERESN